MAAFAATDYSIVFNGVDLSCSDKSFTLNIDHEDLETTAMCAATNNNFRSRVSGLKDWSGSFEFIQDFAGTGSVDAVLATAAFNQTAGYLLTVKPTSAAVGANNPRYFGTILVKYSPFGSTVGDLAMAKVDFVGSGMLTRATT